MPGLWIKHSPDSAALVRKSFFRSLETVGAAADDAYDASLLVSELVGNAVRHAPALPSGHLVVRWSVAGNGCTIAVTDGGETPALQPREPQKSATSGRGLAIVEALSESWGVESGHGNTTVWAIYRLRTMAPAAEMAS